MATGCTGDVVRKLEDVGVTVRRTTPAGFAEAVAGAVEEPAVGVPLDGLDVSLDAAPVTVDPTGAQLEDARAGVTPASTCVADYGTVVLPSRSDGSELVSLFVDHHVAVLRADDVVPDMETAFAEFGVDPRAARRSRILATGPSATADMGELVLGAHGPATVTVIVLEDGE